MKVLYSSSVLRVPPTVNTLVKELGEYLQGESQYSCNTIVVVVTIMKHYVMLMQPLILMVVVTIIVSMSMS